MTHIDLLEPADGGVTPPLQAHPRPDSGEHHAAGAAFQWNDLEAVARDRSFPRPVRCAWTHPPLEDVHYELRASRHPDLRDPLVLRHLSRPHAELWHLFVDTVYYWKVTARQSHRVVAVSPVGRFSTHPEPPRWIAVPGTTNVRDLGGWRLPGSRRVRQGLLYRSAELNSHMEITDEGRAVLLDDLGIRTDLDFRGSMEEARPVLPADRVRWVNIPINPYGEIANPAFHEPYRRVFSVLADDANYPLLFHCWGGADRVGTVAILLLALLGVGDGDVMADYELTSLSIWGERSRTSEQIQSLLAALAPFAGRDGGAGLGRMSEQYLRSIGVTTEEIARLRSSLTEG